MSFQLYPPGERGKFWVARIVVDNHRVEKSTGAMTKAGAHDFAVAYEQELKKATAPGAKAEITFAEAAQRYANWKGLDLEILWNNSRNKRVDARFLVKLSADDLGKRYVNEIKIEDIVDAAKRLYPTHAASARNRAVIRPVAAVMHYASKNGYCGWLRIPAFDEPRPETRAVTDAVASRVEGAVPQGSMKHLMLVWLLRHGTRISQTLGITWDHIDLTEQTYRFYNAKADHWHVLPLHPEVFELLCMIPEADRAPGKQLWPWTGTSSVYAWLRPLARQLGVKFTPHMARHTVGKRLNASGARLKTIMEALGHFDPKSSLRYQSVDIDTVRDAITLAAAPKAPKGRTGTNG